jgi:hypothetical protein
MLRLSGVGREGLVIFKHFLFNNNDLNLSNILFHKNQLEKASLGTLAMILLQSAQW